MNESERFTEPGRWVDDDGVIRYAWPPEGRFADLWARVTTLTTEEERTALQSLISHEVSQTSTLVAYTDDDGTWHDVEPNWDEAHQWLSEVENPCRQVLRVSNTLKWCSTHSEYFHLSDDRCRKAMTDE